MALIPSKDGSEFTLRVVNPFSELLFIRNDIIETLENPEALAIYVYALQMGLPYRVTHKSIKKRYGTGCTLYARAIKYLKAKGFAKEIIERCVDGRITGKWIEIRGDV